MENRKKVKFNGMDLFIAVVVLAVIAAAVWFVGTRRSANEAAASSNVEVRMTVELKAKDESYADAIKVGDTVMIGEKEKISATVENVEVQPAKTLGYDILGGRVLNSTVEEEYDVYVTTVAYGTETTQSIEIDGIAVRVGQNAAMFGKGWSSTGYITGLETAEKQK